MDSLTHRLSQFWNDPVWSKVISAIIFTALTAIYSLLLSAIKKQKFKKLFVNFWTVRFPLWYVALGITVFILASSLFDNPWFVRYLITDSNRMISLDLIKDIL